MCLVPDLLRQVVQHIRRTMSKCANAARACEHIAVTDDYTANTLGSPTSQDGCLPRHAKTLCSHARTCLGAIFDESVADLDLLALCHACLNQRFNRRLQGRLLRSSSRMLQAKIARIQMPCQRPGRRQPAPCTAAQERRVRSRARWLSGRPSRARPALAKNEQVPAA